VAVALTVAAALSVMLAVVVAGVPRHWVRRRCLTDREPPEAPRRGAVLSVGATLAVAVLVGGVLGWALGAAVGYGTFRWQQSLGTEREQLEQTRRALAMPVAFDLLAACLAVGASQHQALSSVAGAMGGTLRRDLSTVAGAMRIGADSVEAWSLVDAPDLRGLQSVLTRVDTSGAPVAPLLAVLAEQQRQQARSTALDASRALGVRLAGPLGLCFLPAFVLIAVVPLVVSLLPFRL
jgi:hypothetical protein